MSNTTAPTVKADSFLTLHYRLFGQAGDIVSTFDASPSTLSMGSGQLTPALEDCLIGLPEGTHTTLELPSGVAFGEKNPELIQWVAKKLLQEHSVASQVYKVGDVVQFPARNNQPELTGRALEIREDGAVLFDFNHPLAGQAVSFEVQIIGVL